jgi:glycosyltransferase involved in cell wall biosynthesis
MLMQENEITMSRPLVSIVMPVFNGARYIGTALQSAFGQEYLPIEVIVVDDSSRDTTAIVSTILCKFDKGANWAAPFLSGLSASSTPSLTI